MTRKSEVEVGSGKDINTVDDMGRKMEIQMNGKNNHCHHFTAETESVKKEEILVKKKASINTHIA